MSTQTQIVINCDEENNADKWWTAARKADRTGLPASCVDLIHGTANRVTVSAEDAELFRAWGSALPGWANGPSYAAEPFVFNPAE